MRCFPLLLIFLALPLQAETLEEAMVKAYTGNPSLQKQRNALRAFDEQVPLAKAAARPSLDADAEVGQAYNSIGGREIDSTPRGVGVTLSQPIYKGGSIEAGISSAERSVLQQRTLLKGAEQELFLAVAQVYFDVARDQTVLSLNKKNEQALGKERQAATDRLNVGDATKTDTSQAESRYAGAVADRVQSEGRLAGSRAAYLRVVGTEPGEIQLPKPDMNLPGTLEEAIQLAQNNRPVVIAARYAEEASTFDVDVAKGGLLPEIGVRASAGRDWDTTPGALAESDSAVISAQLTIPLYRAGADYARTRAAKETASQRRVEVREAMDQARQDVITVWHDLQAARATIKARREQISATELALAGVREESMVGTRTILDRLNAEAEAIQAQVGLVEAERDEVLAMFQLKAAVGELTAEKLKLPIAPYKPEEHYEEVKDKWFGLGSETHDAPLGKDIGTP
jgi:TolC family type I secretion outer membrane protein